jgi:excisionase family DNA binding protein
VRIYIYVEVGMEILLTIKELAAALKLTEQTIKRYVLRNEIPYRKILRAVRFRPSEINDWINNDGLIASVENGLGTIVSLPDEAGAIVLDVQEIGDEK